MAPSDELDTDLIVSGTRAAPTETRHRVTTSDGVELHITHVHPAHPGTQAPVMLVHGLGANRFTFHFPERSFARYLATAGFDAFVVELRGAGASSRPRSWDFDDYLFLDLPVVIDWIRRRTGSPAIHWVGHNSMGGILLMCYGIAHEDTGLLSGVTVGSALDYSIGATGFERLLALRPIIERLPAVPWGRLVRMLAPTLGRRIETPLERFNVVPSNIEPHISRQLHARAFGTIPTPLLSTLATTFEQRGLRTRDGRVYFWEEAPTLELPLMLIAGSGDQQVSMEAVEATAARIGGEQVVVERFGRAHGQADDYGHFDLLLGRRAAREVWPKIARWLRRNR